MADGADLTHFGPLNAQSLCLAIDAFARGPLRVDSMVKRTIPIEQHACQSTTFPIGVFDTAFASRELGLVAGLSSALGKKQRAAKALGQIAIGVLEWVRRVHTESFGAHGDSIGVALATLGTMLIEGNGSDASLMDATLIHIPRIKGGVSRDVGGDLVKSHDATQIQGAIIGDIVLVERLSIFG